MKHDPHIYPAGLTAACTKCHESVSGPHLDEKLCDEALIDGDWYCARCCPVCAEKALEAVVQQQRMEKLGITEQDLYDTLPPKQGDDGR